MGARNSKRSVDISGSNKDTDETQPLEGKLEKIEEGTKVAVNGASHSEPKISQIEEQVSNGDPISLPEPVPVAEVAGPSSPTEEVQLETAETEVIQPPKKKEKVKKKWSFRSMSFSKKDKSKPGKEDSTKDDAADTVPEVAEEKTEDVPSFLSSVTDAIGGATEAVSDAVVSAEHKVEEGLTATQDQVEKISAKVAEKAEALVVKMEAMTVKAVDSVQEMMGLGEAAKADADKVEVALTEAVTNIALPEVNADSIVKEVTTIKVALPDVGKSDSILPEIPNIESTVTNSPKIDSVLPEGVTNIVVPETTKIDSSALKTVTANVELPESVTCDTVLPNPVPKDVVLPTPMSLSDEVSISADQELEALSQVKVAVTKGDEVPPPLPASPPPNSVIAEMLSEVVDTAVDMGKTKEVEQLIEQIDATIPTSAKPISPTTAHIPMVFSEDALPEGGGGDDCPPHVPSEVHFTMSVQSCRRSDASLEGEVFTQVIEPLDSSVTSFHLPEEEINNAEEDEEEEVEQESQDESAKNATETSITTEDTSGPAAKKTSEE